MIKAMPKPRVRVAWVANNEIGEMGGGLRMVDDGKALEKYGINGWRSARAKNAIGSGTTYYEVEVIKTCNSSIWVG